MKQRKAGRFLMRHHLRFQAAALSAAAMLLLTGYTYPSNPSGRGAMIETLGRIAGGVKEEETVNFGQKKFTGYQDKAVLLSSNSRGNYRGYTAKETSKSNGEKIELSFTSFQGVDTLFDFTIKSTETHTVTLGGALKGKAKVFLTKDKKTIIPLWENDGKTPSGKKLTLEPGRYRLRLAASGASGTLSVQLDKKDSLYSHKVEKAYDAYQTVMEPAYDRYEQMAEKAQERYDRALKNASSTYTDSVDEMDKAYDEAADRIGEVEIPTYSDREDGEELQEEYDRKYSDLNRQYGDDLDEARDEYEELVEQAERYQNERMEQAKETLNQAYRKAEKAWDAVIG